MDVPDSDGENMPENKYEFNTKKHVDVSDKSAYKTVKSSSFVDSSLAHAYVQKDFYPNVLIADDDDMQLQSLMDHFNYITGQEGSKQFCDMAEDGSQLVKMYEQRLNLAI